MKYYQNSTLVYTSTVAPAYPLQVDTSLNTVNAGVYNVVISGTRVTASPINYVLQDVQGSTRAVMSGTSVVARHDFLPFGEELGAGVGMRTGAQGYGVVDKIRQRYGLTERDDTTGLDHTWWRKYENLSGRWTTADPYLGSMTIANPQSFNRYAYVQNDPVNFVDPSGLLPCYDAWCGSGGGSGWGGGYSGGNGWGSDPRPGQGVITGDRTYSTYFPDRELIVFWAWSPFPELTQQVQQYSWLGFAGGFGGIGAPQEPTPQPHPSPTPGSPQNSTPSSNDFWKCLNGWKFSALVGDLTKGSRLQGAAQTTASILEVGAPMSTAGDAVATGYKATQTTLGRPQPYASGLNWALRRMSTAR